MEEVGLHYHVAAARDALRDARLRGTQTGRVEEEDDGGPGAAAIGGHDLGRAGSVGRLELDLACRHGHRPSAASSASRFAGGMVTRRPRDWKEDLQTFLPMGKLAPWLERRPGAQRRRAKIASGAPKRWRATCGRSRAPSYGAFAQSPPGRRSRCHKAPCWSVWRSRAPRPSPTWRAWST